MIGSSPSRFGFPAVLILALAFSAGAVAGQESGPLVGAEYRVKAAFIYHFVRFTHWPPSVFAEPDSPVVLCVAGEPAGIEALFTLRDKTVRGRRIVVRRFDAKGEMRCHVLFAGGDDPEAIARWLQAARGPGVLTVGESPVFVDACGIINFFLENDHLRFAVNLAAAGRANIRFSSQLLMSAEILTDPEGCGRPAVPSEE